MGNRPKISNIYRVQGFGNPNTLNSFSAKAEENYKGIEQAKQFSVARFGGPTSSFGQAFLNIDPTAAAGALGIKFGSSKGSTLSGLGNTANALASLGSSFEEASFYGIKPEEYGGIPARPMGPTARGSQGKTGRELDEQWIKDIKEAEKRAESKIQQKQQELEPLRQQAKEKFGLDLSAVQVYHNRGTIEGALATDIPKKTFGQKELTLDYLARENNELVKEYDTIADQIEKEGNPLIAQKRFSEQLEPLGKRITEIQGDYGKVAQAIETRKPRFIEVSDYGRNPNRFKDIQIIRGRIQQARAMNLKESEQDPYKKQAITFDEENYKSIDKQLAFEEQRYKKAIGQESVNRGSTQVPQIIGGSGPPPLPVPVFPQQQQRKSNLLAGLPTDPLDIAQSRYGIGKMNKNERQWITQARQKRSKNKMDKFFDFDFNFGGGF